MIRHTITAALLLLGLGSGSTAQEGKPKPEFAAVPFGVGERMSYRVKLGIVGEVGHGTFEVDTVLHTIDGHSTYALRFLVTGGAFFMHVNDDYRSWLDVQTLVARRFKQDQKEVRYERHRTFNFFPEEKRWARADNDEKGDLPTNEPLDDVSFIYFIRTMPLEVGKTYTLNRYFKEDGNPVTIQVLRKQTITVPAGKFKTIVVRPIIRTKGLFSEGGEAEVYFTDDPRRMLVALRSKVKLLKSLDMNLESYTPGRRLASSTDE